MAPKVHTTTTTTTSTTSSTTTTTTLPHLLIQPAAATLPLPGPGVSYGSGTNNPNIALYEQRLADLHFDPGTIDNVYDAKTTFAVQGLQKEVGLNRNGRIGDAEVTALNKFTYTAPQGNTEEPNRLEVSLDKQTAVLYENFQVRLITTVSTGGGYHYCYTAKKSGRHVCSTALTPTGRYTFNYRYKGWQEGDLGHLYNPVYFNGGIAVHGYTSVPTKAASHGCVRIPMYVADYFPSLVTTGEPVYVFATTPVVGIPDQVSNVVTTTTTIPETTTTIPETTTAVIAVPLSAPGVTTTTGH